MKNRSLIGAGLAAAVLGLSVAGFAASDASAKTLKSGNRVSDKQRSVLRF